MPVIFFFCQKKKMGLAKMYCKKEEEEKNLVSQPQKGEAK
jgi:hypothetical protein